jgi:hypothetical protein
MSASVTTSGPSLPPSAVAFPGRADSWTRSRRGVFDPLIGLRPYSSQQCAQEPLKIMPRVVFAGATPARPRGEARSRPRPPWRPESPSRTTGWHVAACPCPGLGLTSPRPQRKGESESGRRHYGDRMVRAEYPATALQRVLAEGPCRLRLSSWPGRPAAPHPPGDRGVDRERAG